MNEIIFGKIQGYLEAIALANSLFDYQIRYVFNFYEIDYHENVSQSVKEHICNEYISFIKCNSGREDNKLLSAFENNFNLVHIHNWEEELNNELPDWFFRGSLANYEGYEEVKLSKNAYVNITLLVQNFIDLINEFFNGEPFEVWKLNEFFCNKLYCFWGGLHYLDYIFSFHNKIFVLHFHYVD